MTLQLATSGMSAHQRALAGIAFMDRTSPGWRGKINRQKLNIMYDCGCVVGQVHGSYNANRGKGKLLPNNKVAADRGFFAYSHGTAGETAEYAALTKAWRDILAAEDAVRELATQTAGQRRLAKAA